MLQLRILEAGAQASAFSPKAPQSSWVLPAPPSLPSAGPPHPHGGLPPASSAPAPSATAAIGIFEKQSFWFPWSNTLNAFCCITINDKTDIAWTLLTAGRSYPSGLLLLKLQPNWVTSWLVGGSRPPHCHASSHAIRQNTLSSCSPRHIWHFTSYGISPCLIHRGHDLWAFALSSTLNLSLTALPTLSWVYSTEILIFFSFLGDRLICGSPSTLWVTESLNLLHRLWSHPACFQIPAPPRLTVWPSAGHFMSVRLGCLIREWHKKFLVASTANNSYYLMIIIKLINICKGDRTVPAMQQTPCDY